MSLKVESMRSTSGGVATVAMKAGQEQVIPAESLDLMDWERVYIDLLEFKEEKGFANLVVQPDTPRRIMAATEPRLYTLIADESVVKPRSFEDVAILREAVLSILRKYVEKYYRVSQERWESDNMVYGTLTTKDPNFQDYTVSIPRSEAS